MSFKIERLISGRFEEHSGATTASLKAAAAEQSAACHTPSFLSSVSCLNCYYYQIKPKMPQKYL